MVRILVYTTPSFSGQKMFTHLWFSSVFYWYLWDISKPFFFPSKFFSDHLLPLFYHMAPCHPLHRPPWVHFILIVRSEANPAMRLGGYTGRSQIVWCSILSWACTGSKSLRNWRNKLESRNKHGAKENNTGQDFLTQALQVMESKLPHQSPRLGSYHLILALLKSNNDNNKCHITASWAVFLCYMWYKAFYIHYLV